MGMNSMYIAKDAWPSSLNVPVAGRVDHPHEPPLSDNQQGLHLLMGAEMQEYDMQRQTPAHQRREWRPHSIIPWTPFANGSLDGRAPLVRQGSSCHASRCIPGERLQGGRPGPGVPRVPRGPRQSKKYTVVCVRVDGEPRFVSMYRSRLSSCALSLPIFLCLPTLCSVAG